MHSPVARLAPLFGAVMLYASACASPNLSDPDRVDDLHAEPKPRKPPSKVGDTLPTPVPEAPPPVMPSANTPPAAPLIYAHTADTLHSFDARTRKLAPIGKLGCLSASDRLLDIAVDEAGAMFGSQSRE